jgi:hypothetical protein
VAVLDGASPADPAGAFHEAWRLMATTALVTAAIGLALGRVRALGAAPQPAAGSA